MILLSSDSYKIRDEADLLYIKENERGYRAVLIEREMECIELEVRVKGSYTSNDDRLSFLEAMTVYDVRVLYWYSQDTLSHTMLDSRNIL